MYVYYLPKKRKFNKPTSLSFCSFCFAGSNSGIASFSLLSGISCISNVPYFCSFILYKILFFIIFFYIDRNRLFLSLHSNIRYIYLLTKGLYKIMNIHLIFQDFHYDIVIQRSKKNLFYHIK